MWAVCGQESFRVRREQQITAACRAKEAGEKHKKCIRKQERHWSATSEERRWITRASRQRGRKYVMGKKKLQTRPKLIRVGTNERDRRDWVKIRKSTNETQVSQRERIQTWNRNNISNAWNRSITHWGKRGETKVQRWTKCDRNNVADETWDVFRGTWAWCISVGLPLVSSEARSRTPIEFKLWMS